MANNKKQNNNTSVSRNPMGYPPIGFGAPASNNNINTKKKNKAKSKKDLERLAYRRDRAKTLRSRQEFALENISYRKKLEDVQGKGVLDHSYYKLPEDKKPRKRKDYFFVMRKFVCFLMFLILLISVAFYALSYLKLSMVPVEYTALFVEVDKPVANEEDNENTVVAAEEEAEEEVEEEAEPAAAAFDGVAYNLLDPVFGFIKYIGAKFNLTLDFGDSPLYDSLIAKVEVGMSDNIASYVILGFPVAIILYAIIALVMMFKALFGMFGSKIFKKFGLGSFLMIICGAITAFGGLAATLDLGEKMVYADVVGILMGYLQKTGGFTGGYGLLIMIALPVFILILSMFAKKKIPYSIFDNISV